jgi:transcriptional regulator with XRE-family HTH domain
MMEVAKRFGENLRRLRKGAGISQEELGLRCSLHRTEIGLLERGARVPRIDTLIKIASGLGVRIDCKLLAGISWTPATTEAGGFKIKSRIELRLLVRVVWTTLRASSEQRVALSQS